MQSAEIRALGANSEIVQGGTTPWRPHNFVHRRSGVVLDTIVCGKDLFRRREMIGIQTTRILRCGC